MPKRFTDSEKFRDTWYRKLSPTHKCIWEYMLSECSIAGIIEIDIDSMSFHIGAEVSLSDLEVFEDRLVWITKTKVFLPSFILFQQKELNHNNPAHKNIFKELEKYNIPETLDTTGIQCPFKGASKTLQRVASNSKGNSKGKGNSKKEIMKIEKPHDVGQQIWDDFLYHRKQKKAKLTETSLNGIIKQSQKAGWTLEDALIEICLRGWTGFKAEWVEKNTKGNIKNERHQEIDSVGDRLIARLRAEDERKEARANSEDGAAVLCDTGHVWENPRAIGYSNDGND